MAVWRLRVRSSDAALFAGTAAVMRNRGDVFDGGNFEADGLERPDGGFTAGAGPFDPDFDFLHAVSHGLAGGILSDLLRGVGRAFARALEANAATRATVRIVFFMVFQFGVFGFRQCPPPQPGREKHLRTEASGFRSKNQEVFPK